MVKKEDKNILTSSTPFNSFYCRMESMNICLLCRPHSLNPMFSVFLCIHNNSNGSSGSALVEIPLSLSQPLNISSYRKMLNCPLVSPLLNKIAATITEIHPGAVKIFL